MSQVWLHNNRRLLVPLCIPALFLVVAGISSGIIGVYQGAAWFWIGGILLVLALVYGVIGWVYVRRSRLEYEPGWLLVHAGWGSTITVPIDIVECFFMGQAPSLVRGPDGKEAETATVVVRLAEKAVQWQSRSFPAHLGQWCDGYLIIRGTWCEPIDMDLLNRLNQNLAEAHRQQKNQVVRAES